MPLILLKALITIFIVTALSIIAERASPRLAGVLSGFPTGTAITLTFIGIEQGPRFAAESALHNLAGMSAMLCLLYVYAQIASLAAWRPRLLAPILSASTFLSGAALLHGLNLPAWATLALSIAAILLFQRLFRAYPDQPIAQRVQFGAGVLVFRAGVAAAVVLLVTGVARSVGPAWAGLFTSFPATVFPLLIILQRAYGPAPCLAVIKNIPRGLWSLLAFTLLLAWANPRLGVGWSRLLALLGALLVLALTLWSRGKPNPNEAADKTAAQS